MAPFQDVFWSSDYISGINALLDNLKKGQDQSQYVLQYFQKYTDLMDSQGVQLHQIFKNHKKYADRHPQRMLSETQKHAMKAIFDVDADCTTVDDIIEEQFSLTERQSLDQQKTLSKIESDVILVLKDFIDDFEEFSQTSKRDLNASYRNYKRCIQKTNSFKSKFEAKLRVIEDITSASSEINLPSDPPALLEKETSTKKTSVVETDDKKDNEEEAAEDLFEFPLRLGNVPIQSAAFLKSILSTMLEEIPIKRRMIPIPGINNEYFKSEDFASWVKLNFPKEDTTSRVEKFGQDMISLGLISNWNKLAHNQFVSESGYYYEFTDLARYTASFEDEEEKDKEVVSDHKISEPADSTKYGIPKTAVNTTEVWNGIKKTLSTHKDVGVYKEEVEQLKAQYFQSLNESIESKLQLESLILSLSKKSETYQRNRSQLLHKLQLRFNQYVISQQKDYLSQLEALRDSISGLATESTELELLKPIVFGTSGWYWPVSETRFVDYTNKESSLELFETDVLNLGVDENNEDHKTNSIPLFIYLIISRLDQEDGVGLYWTSSLDFIGAQNIKKELMKQIFLLTHSVHSVSAKTRSIVDYLFKKYETNEIVNFTKFWLLELPDSLLPFTVYDSLLQSYDAAEPTDVKLHIIGSIPRQNLATLLLLISHLEKHIKTPIVELSTNKGIPFTHLLLRPSTTKTQYISILDTHVLSNLLADLFNTDFQTSLNKKLESLEKYHEEKLQRVEDSISIYKRSHERKDSELVSLRAQPLSSRTTVADHLNVDGLKPFKTVSPNMTPSGSPRGSRSNSGTFSVKTNFLSPATLKRPSDNLNKRNSRGFDRGMVNLSKNEEATDKNDQALQKIEDPKRSDDQVKQNVEE